MLMVLTGFTSCIDLESDPVFFSDVFIVSRLINGDTLYSVDAQVQCNMPMKSVVMESEKNAGDIQLYPLYSDSAMFEYATPLQNYKPQIPGQGYYYFNITLPDNSTHSHSDLLNSNVLKPFSLDSLYYNGNEMSTTFDWPSVTGSDYYYARVMKHDTIVFNSGWINNEFTSIKLTPNSLGWYSDFTPKAGDSLQFVVFAIIAEDMMYNNMLEIQSVAFSSPSAFVWGE